MTKTQDRLMAGPNKPAVDKFEYLQHISELMRFQDKMPTNRFVDKNDAYESIGCGPRSSMYIFAH